MDFLFQLLAFLGISGSSFIDGKAKDLVPADLYSLEIEDQRKMKSIGAPATILLMLFLFIVGFLSSKNSGSMNVNSPWASTIFWSGLALIITAITLVNMLKNREYARNPKFPKRFVILDLTSKAILFFCGFYLCLSNLAESLQHLG